MLPLLSTLLLNTDAAEGVIDTPTDVENTGVEAGKDTEEDEDEDGEVLEVIDNIKFVKKEYKKEFLKGKAFAAPRFSSVSQALNHIDTQLKLQQKHKSQLEKGGVTAEDVLLDNLHSMIDNKLRTRVKAEASVKNSADKEWINTAPTVLFTPKEAHAWIPGIREPGVGNQIKILSSKIVEFQKAGIGMENPEFIKVMMELAQVAGSTVKV